MTTDTSLICFKSITNFTSELGELFDSKQRSLKLYCRLIKKTTLSHDKVILKHIDAFRKFCVTNREGIVEKKVDKFILQKISYSETVYIDMSEIFKLADNPTKKVIWDHLLCISALVDPAGRAKEILKENLEAGKTSGQETNFLTEIINKVEATVDPNLNPMEAVSSIMKSGIFTDLISGMNNDLSNGSLDIGKLMGAVQGMVGKLGQTNSDNSGSGLQGDAGNAINMLTSMMENIGNGTSSETPGNLGNIMGMMTTMMGSTTTGQPTPSTATIEEE